MNAVTTNGMPDRMNAVTTNGNAVTTNRRPVSLMEQEGEKGTQLFLRQKGCEKSCVPFSVPPCRLYPHALTRASGQLSKSLNPVEQECGSRVVVVSYTFWGFDAMSPGHRVVIASPPDREGLVAEIWHGDEMWAEGVRSARTEKCKEKESAKQQYYWLVQLSGNPLVQ